MNILIRDFIEHDYRWCKILVNRFKCLRFAAHSVGWQETNFWTSGKNLRENISVLHRRLTIWIMNLNLLYRCLSRGPADGDCNDFWKMTSNLLIPILIKIIMRVDLISSHKRKLLVCFSPLKTSWSLDTNHEKNLAPRSHLSLSSDERIFLSGDDKIPTCCLVNRSEFCLRLTRNAHLKQAAVLRWRDIGVHSIIWECGSLECYIFTLILKKPIVSKCDKWNTWSWFNFWFELEGICFKRNMDISSSSMCLYSLSIH